MNKFMKTTLEINKNTFLVNIIFMMSLKYLIDTVQYFFKQNKHLFKLVFSSSFILFIFIFNSSKEIIRDHIHKLVSLCSL